MPRKNVRWTQNKKNRLKRAFRKNLSLIEIAKLFDTTISAIATQKHLMIKSGELKIKPEETGYRWILDKITDRLPKSELRKLPKYYHFKKYPEMVEKINKRKSRKPKLVDTPENILFSNTKWNDAKIKELIKLYQDGFNRGKSCMQTEEEIAAKLGVGRSVISTRKSIASRNGYVFPKFERSKTRRINKNVAEDNSQYMRNMEFWDGLYDENKVKRKRMRDFEKEYWRNMPIQEPRPDLKINKAIEAMATGFELISEALKDILIK